MSRTFDVAIGRANHYNSHYMKNRGPLLLVAGLVTILVFIGGVRHGQRVEQYNKTVAYMISLTPPTQPPSPSPTPLAIKYKTLSHKPCSTSFLYPDYLKPGKETSNSGELKQGEATQLVFSCAAAKPKFPSFEDDAAATEAAKVNNVTGRRIYFKMNKDLQPLVDSSIKYGVR